MIGRGSVGTILATALLVGVGALPAGAATPKRSSKASVTKTVKRCHTAKRTGSNVRVCTRVRVRCHTARRKGRDVRVCTPVRKRKPAPAGVSLAPIDYTAVTGLSQPAYTDVVRTTHELTVADGTRLHLEIVKPAGAANLGVILEASPYHGTLYDRSGGRMIPLAGKDGKLTGLSGFFPKRGYAVVFMDLRGTGLSSGCLNTLGPADQSDLRDTVQ